MHSFHSEVEKQRKSTDKEYRELTDELARNKSKQTDLEEEKFELDAEVDKQASSLAEKERDYQTLMKDYEYAKEREAVLMGDR